MITSSNPQLDLAYEFVQHTNKNIFLTGKAGTGKTTFLHRIQEESLKRLAVVAPTGVAAINAGGVTIHSLFQLPFGPIVPGQKRVNDADRQFRFSKKKINLIRSLDLLIIDEISMVRADILDGIDEVLKRYLDRNLPFGGLQLLMIGDLHQLPPVVKEEEWRLLSPHYQTPYFFGSLALQETDPIQIELKHIYRQSDETFIRLLNKVRDNQLDEEVLETLNSRYIANFESTKEEPYIILTSHNATANGINGEELGKLSTPVHTFEAEVKGKFPEHAYPTAKTLFLKVGAQVLFIKNDPSHLKQYYNGKIGEVVKIESEIVHVQCPNEPQSILVSKAEWENKKYNLDESTKEVSEELLGTFTQFPLKLAWAITIHKSQGLTFERAIIDAKAAFAHGQVYVALSRCTSFEGIVLRSKLAFSSVKTDDVVKNYSTEAEKNAPTDVTLQKAKRNYQEFLLRELFNFQRTERGLNAINRLFLEHENSLTTAALSQVQALMGTARNQVFTFSNKFLRILPTYFSETSLPEENEELQGRIKKGSVFFSDKLTKEILPLVKKIPILTDSKELKKRVRNNLKKLEEILFIKNACFVTCQKGFSVNTYAKAKANAAIDFTLNKTTTSQTANPIPDISAHPDLYQQFLTWRTKLAAEKKIQPYEIISTRAILALTHYLPTTSANLKSIRGIGDTKVRLYGADIVELIDLYCQEKQISANQMPPPPPAKKPKINTKEVSLSLYKSGQKIEAIAKTRGLTAGTIAGHLGHYITLGEISVYDLMERTKVDELAQIFSENKETSFSELKKKYEDKYSYEDMRMVTNYLKFKEKENQ